MFMPVGLFKNYEETAGRATSLGKWDTKILDQTNWEIHVYHLEKITTVAFQAFEAFTPRSVKMLTLKALDSQYF